ncbi:MAG: Fur family transcriptional regulator [Desulfomonilaceae bacterium]
MHTQLNRRMTKQRQIIIEELKKVTSHPTADQLYEIVRKKLPKISLSTVYRNLETLSAEGTILKMDAAGTQKRFDATVENHYHIRCSRCGRVDDVDMETIPEIEEIARMRSNYQSVSHVVEFTGICPDCFARG